MNKEKNNGKKKLIITMAVALILLVGVTVSYGYIALVSSSKNQEVSVGTGSINLELDDADSGSVEANLNLGGSITKTLKITNKGTKPGKVQINWKNLINTYNSRSLSYTLETSSNKTSGYTSIEALRENVPVSTEAKEVPLSKEITVPVQSAPIYYRVTITFNNLSDVDQSGDVNATLTTQFSLSEPENLSKKVIAVLDGKVKNGNPDFSSSSPNLLYGVREDEIVSTDQQDFENGYVYYADEYKIGQGGKINFINPKVAKYKDIYTSLIGKYIADADLSSSNSGDVNVACSNLTYFYKVQTATSSSYTLVTMVSESKYKSTLEEDISFRTLNVSMTSNKDNYITYSNSPIFYEVGGRYSLSNPQVCKYSECYSSLIGKYILSTTGSTSNTPVNTPTFIINKVNEATLSNMNVTKYRGNSIRVFDENDSGVFTMKDDYGDSYYYRGAVKNNNVMFGGFKWKILRINGDGSLRLIYANGDDNDKYIDSGNGTILNTKIDDQKYLGYMFGGSSEDTASTSLDDAFTNKYSSNLKKVVDTWYENNLTHYSNYLSDTLFCNDREFLRTTSHPTNGDSVIFAAYDRIKSDNTNNPTLTCKQKNDRFTVDDETVGNGDLTYPIGLVTADELSIAGLGVQKTLDDEETNYLAGYKDMHTMTPSYYVFNSYGSSIMWRTGINGNSAYLTTPLPSVGDYDAHIAPVINIKPVYALKMIGTGTDADPFMIPGVN